MLRWCARDGTQTPVRLIRKDNPMPTACARISASIRVKRAAAAIWSTRPSISGASSAMQSTTQGMFRILPVGSRPASASPSSAAARAAFSCAYYLRLMGHSVTIFEEKKRLGGMLRYGIPAYRLPREKAGRGNCLHSVHRVEVHTEVTVGKDISFEQLHKDYDCLYVAIGAHTDKKPAFPARTAKNVMSAVEMLRAIGDNEMPDFTGKQVVVIGGGNVAMDVTKTPSVWALPASPASIARRIADMSALPDEVQGAIAEGAEIRELSAPVRIEANRSVRGRRPLGAAADHRPCRQVRQPRPDAADQPEERIPADIIVVAIGQGVEIAGFEQAGIPIKRGNVYGRKLQPDRQHGKRLCRRRLRDRPGHRHPRHRGRQGRGGQYRRAARLPP